MPFECPNIFNKSIQSPLESHQFDKIETDIADNLQNKYLLNTSFRSAT